MLAISKVVEILAILTLPHHKTGYISDHSPMMLSFAQEFLNTKPTYLGKPCRYFQVTRQLINTFVGSIIFHNPGKENRKIKNMD